MVHQVTHLERLEPPGCGVPFERTLPRSFNPSSVRNFAPVASGVYGLSNAREWIYIGESDDIQAALFEHLSNPDSELMRLGPKGFVLEICDRAKRMARQERLIAEYRPLLNQRIR
jgi:hypothetical protein